MPTDTWWNLPPDKRERIIHAAKVEFAKGGFSAGSLNVISRDAGIAKGSLFQYFTDKLDLFATICDAGSEDIQAAALKGVDPDTMGYFEAVHRMMTNWLRFFRAHPVERGIAFAAANEVDPEARAAVRSITNERFVTVFAPMAKRAADLGELRPGVDTDQLVAMTVMLFRHLNSAPFYEHMDPVLDLTRKSAKEVERISHELVEALARAYTG
ncbi:MAG TPA: TetR/AcrR family transcriptional regulator [Acidimicrobiales bacterium]|nr:TetR/AcrR family transcriptional regulator [Acidimicrobiales bacterium]